jgi:hypothetical protein
METPEIRIPITVNKKHFEWDRHTITGLEVLELAQEKPEDFRVVIKRKGEDDIPVRDDDHVDLRKEDDRHFRTVQKHSTEG